MKLWLISMPKLISTEYDIIYSPGGPGGLDRCKGCFVSDCMYDWVGPEALPKIATDLGGY